MRLFPVKFCESCQCIWIWEHFQATAFSAYQYSQVSISLRSNIHITNDGLLKLQWSAQLEEQYNNNDVRNNCSVRLIYLATCTTDDCVCVCVFILFHLLVSSDCKTSVTYLRCSDQRSFVVSIARGFCQVPSSPYLKMSYFTFKDENSSPLHTGEKTIWYIGVSKKIIYVDVGYKSATQ